MHAVYTVRKCVDLTEGRGPMIPVAAFYTRDAANEAVLLLCRDERIPVGIGLVDISETPVYKNVQEWNEGKLMQLRQQALAKLSPEERAALGHA